MNVRFNLSHPENKKSGVRLILTHRGKVYRKVVPNISVCPKDWRPSSQKTGNQRADQRLKEIRLELLSHLDDLSSERMVLNELRNVLEGEESTQRAGRKGDAPSRFWAYFAKWSMRPCHSFKDRRLAYRKVRELMGDKDDYQDIDRVWISRFNDRMDSMGYSQNYQSTITAKLRTCLKEAFENGDTDCEGYRDLKTKWRTADTAYLTREEVDTLWTAQLSGRDAMARDLFILGVFTAARFQNYSTLSLENIKDGTVEFVQPKTLGRVILPVSPKVRDILERNGGTAPRMSQQEFNRRIKEICRSLGMTETIDVVKVEGGNRNIERRQKWELVSSHTARRTGATLLYLSGVPMRQCMMLTGHTTEANFMKYIKVTKEQNARLLADNPFFK